METSGKCPVRSADNVCAVDVPGSWATSMSALGRMGLGFRFQVLGFIRGSSGVLGSSIRETP